jgi:hypothetical protein
MTRRSEASAGTVHGLGKLGLGRYNVHFPLGHDMHDDLVGRTGQGKQWGLYTKVDTTNEEERSRTTPFARCPAHPLARPTSATRGAVLATVSELRIESASMLFLDSADPDERGGS